jgi:hypothetical protein
MQILDRYIWKAWVGRTIVFCATIETANQKYTRIVLDDGRGYDFDKESGWRPFTVGWVNQKPPAALILRELIESSEWGKPEEETTHA